MLSFASFLEMSRKLCPFDYRVPKVVGPSVSEQIRKSDSVHLADCQGGGSRGQKKDVGVTYSAYPIVINLMQLIAYKG